MDFRIEDVRLESDRPQVVEFGRKPSSRFSIVDMSF